MELNSKPNEGNFREEVRRFLRGNPIENFPCQHEDEGYGIGAWSRDFYRKIGEMGWISCWWPREYGGEERPLAERLAMMEEFAYAQAPAFTLLMAQSIATSIIERGNPFLKKEFLPRISAGEVTFWLAMSEPDAGSDLLALKTEAHRDGDHYIINGQKVWSSRAHLADYGYLLVRTNPDVPRHKGLSLFLLDKNLPGVSVVPIINFQGIHHHNAIFLDNVRVHKDFLLGEEDKGFYHVLDGLEFDRFWARFPKAAFCMGVLDNLVHYITETKLPLDNNLKYKMAESMIEIKACHVIFWHAARMMEHGEKMNVEGTLAKAMADEMGQRLFSLGLEIMGLYPPAGEDPKWQSLRDKFIMWSQFSVGHTLAGGSSEIIRNTIAVRGLGLPRG